MSFRRFFGIINVKFGSARVSIICYGVIVYMTVKEIVILFVSCSLMLIVVCADISQFTRFRAETGFIKSPHYPNPYPSGESLVYEFSGETDLIRLMILDFHIGSRQGNVCISDNIEVEYTNRKRDKLCGKDLFNYTIAAYERVKLTFTRQNNTRKWRGFRLAYSFSEIKECGTTEFGQESGEIGVITSPCYPFPGYPPRITCAYQLKAFVQFRILLKFDEFDFHNSPGCYMDYMDIFTVDPGNRYSLIGRFCGSKTLPPIISDDTKLVLRLHTESNRFYRGFKITYKFIKESELADAQSDAACGQDFFRGHSGEILVSNLPPKINCAWMIRAPTGWRVLLLIKKLKLGTSNFCTDKYLTIYEGYPGRGEDPVDEFCGDMTVEGKEILSDNSIIFIKHSTGAEGVTGSEGVHLLWTAVNTEATGKQCPGFLCNGGRVCKDTSGLTCRELPQYCLYEDVRCDGKANCGLQDRSDEEFCLTLWSRVLFLFLSAFLASSLISCTIVLLRRRGYSCPPCCNSKSSNDRSENSMTAVTGPAGPMLLADNGPGSGGGAPMELTDMLELQTITPLGKADRTTFPDLGRENDVDLDNCAVNGEDRLGSKIKKNSYQMVISYMNNNADHFPPEDQYFPK